MDSKDLVKYAVCGLCGLAFGIAAEKGRVHEPSLIRGQMDFSRFVMMKMFLGATASGMASLSLFTMFSSGFRRRFGDARVEFMSCLSNKGYLSAILGGALLGSGITIAGACPGMVLVQVGAGIQNSLYTLAGGLAGAFVYAILEPTIMELVGTRDFSSHKTLDNGRNYAAIALPFAAVIGCAVGAIENYRPWITDVNVGWFSAGSPLSMKAWPPYIAGAIIGCLQPVVVMTVRDTLGTSQSYCTVLSQLLVTDSLRRALPYLSKYRSGLGNWWQVVFVGGAVVGGYLSASASGSLFPLSPVTQTQALLGGALMVFGARLASGCTSGHGLSGMALLVMNSFAVVCSMFAGAMGTYAAMKTGIINV